MPRGLESCIDERIVCLAYKQRHAEHHDCHGEHGTAQEHHVPGGGAVLACHTDKVPVAPFPDGHAEEDCHHPQPEVVGYGAYADIRVEFLRSTEGLHEELLHLAEVGKVEQASSQGDKSHGIEVQEGRGDEVHHLAVSGTSLMVEGGQRFAHVLHEGVFLEQEDDAEVEAPACKVPTGTVPETGQEPRGQDIEPLVPAVTAQGYVDIVAEETSQGDMPTVPEVGDGVTAVRVAEVLVEVEPEATPNAYGHVGIAGEVKVDLQGVCQYAYPGTRGGASVEAVHQELFRHDAHLVGNDNLLAQTVDEAEYSVGHVAHLHLAPVNLLGNGAVAHDRAGNELGEHAYVEQKVHEAPLGRAFLLINIYQIGYTLEDVETDAYGQGYPGVGHGYANHGKGSCRKRGVLENAQRQHVGDDAYVQCQFPVRGLRVYELAYVEIDEHQCEHQEHIHRFAPCIEEQGEEHKAGIAAPVRGEPLPVHVCGKHIGEEECRQEDKEKE